MHLSEDSGAKLEEHFKVVLSILDASKGMLDLRDDWSFELPKRNMYWKKTEIQEYLMNQAVGRRIFCFAPKLCQMLSKEEYDDDLLPSKAYLVMSTAFQIPHDI